MAALSAGALALASLGGCAQDDGRVKLDFFQFKGEANEHFRTLVERFEAANPDVDVVINETPDADTAIRTLLVKGRTPDVMTLNGSGKFGELAKAGVFHDFTGDPLLDELNPAAVQIMQDLGTYRGEEVNSLPYWLNADGIIYNRDIFAEHQLDPPTTWDELIEVCDTLQANGVQPFFGTLADAWTALPSLNGLGAYPAAEGFFEAADQAEGALGTSGAPSFARDWRETFERQSQLFAYAGAQASANSYDDGNAAFANGGSAMLMQGVWALPMVRQLNPDIDAGVFPYPTDAAKDRLLVSGVDVTIAIGRDTPRLEAAKRFVDFLFQAEQLEWIAAQQNMFSARADSPGSGDPALVELQPLFDAGQVAGFPDHQFSASVPLQQIDQQFLMDGDLDGALATLDDEWSKVAARDTRKGI
ncbi:MAG: extracellular solute-binding protein [Propionibacteriaceae bacterium]|nr:extracellular solute-binding protein [Propionibacteriaceae bacterium]